MQAKKIKTACLNDIYIMQLEPYYGGRKKVIVYNTYADGGKLHFDVFIPTDKSRAELVAKDTDAQAVQYAQEFLKLIGKQQPGDLVVNMCDRCHIDDTSLYANELWQLPGKDVFIWPMEGCPKPG